MSHPLTTAHLRIARPTDNLTPLKHFYIDGLGFHILYSAENHNGFDVLMLGADHAPYHLEFVRVHHHPAGRAPTQDNLLVFYLPELAEWEAAVTRMERCGFESVRSFNPYWERDGKGRTFEDADGYRVVFWNGGWENAGARVRFEESLT